MNRYVGGYCWQSVTDELGLQGWRESNGKFHIVKTFGLEPWELYAGDFRSDKHMEDLLYTASRFKLVIELAIKFSAITGCPRPDCKAFHFTPSTLP